MNPRLNRGEYWLLSSAVEYSLPLPLLALPEGPPCDRHTIDVALNKPGHGLTVEDLRLTLSRMARHGWIEFSRDQQRVSLDAAALADALVERGKFLDRIYYALTPSGGRVWEAFARPDWSRYIDDCNSSGYEELADGEITTMERSQLERYFAVIARELLLEPDTCELHELRPWNATYWKVLPHAFRFTFRYRQRPHDPRGHMSSQWHRERWCRWR